MRLFLLVCVAPAGLLIGTSCPAQLPQPREAGEPAEQAEGQGDPSTDSGGVPTLGGIQFWTDALLFHDWRIQRNAISGHYRLLDGHNRRHAWGSFAHCRSELEQIKRQRNLAPMCGRAVILLHGLADPRSTMSKMANFLKTSGHYTVLYFAYASTQAEVAEHARALAEVIANLEGITEINFVAHSLGNLVIRHYLADQMELATGRQLDPRIRRIVMLGPPNRGAMLAERLGRNRIFLFFAGKSGQQLASQWQELAAHLAIPPCEFGIIAGGKLTRNGGNPLIQGDDDFIVRVDETRLIGARDFVVLPVLHMTMMNDPTVQEYTLRFLEHGYFISDEQRQPISDSEAR